MKLQACTFTRCRKTQKRPPNNKPEKGVAVLGHFDLYDVDYILDTNGKKVPHVWSYYLLQGPLSYIEI